MKTDPLDPDFVERIFGAFVNGLSVRKVARKFGTKPTVVWEVIRQRLLEVVRAKEQGLSYGRIAVRLTARQYTAIFTGRNCPLEIGQTRFHLTPDEASDLFGWLNDEIADEASSLRRKALENLVYKMQAEEKRAEARVKILHA